ncbi:response regulator [Mucilaginibacter corticis]|uniref:response regulator n=1 Tax=Mucilaginibacter corticis TaxID=2597670 RepID=UPI001642F717|nr:response regulator [Mucilaginibacter corticis]
MKKILIIEDDADTAEVVTLIFESAFEIISVNDLIPIERVIYMNPNIIILDNRLNSGLGSAFCKELKANPFTRYIPVLFFSGEMGLEKIANEVGADAYLEKPFDLIDLENVVRKFSGSLPTS